MKQLICLFLTIFLCATPPLQAAVVLNPYVGLALGVLLEVALDQGIDAIKSNGKQPVDRKQLDQALNQHLAQLEKKLSLSQLRDRAQIDEGIRAIRRTQILLARVQHVQNENINQLRAEIAEERRAVANLAMRMERLEAKVDGIDQKLDKVLDKQEREYDLLTAECRDRRGSPTFGDYRVPETEDEIMVDRQIIEEGRVDLQVFLETCTRQLDQRGLLILLDLHGQQTPLRSELLVTLKDVSRRGEVLQRFRSRMNPEGRAEIFLPYSELNVPLPNGRFELAVVFAIDQQSVYNWVGHVVACYPGRHYQCSWY